MHRAPCACNYWRVEARDGNDLALATGSRTGLQQRIAYQCALIPHRRFGRQLRYTFGRMNAQIERRSPPCPRHTWQW
jgi:hypothetical protein